ncbi:multisubunit sodium/proton antiporter, MrpF subunit [Blastococcus sp. DSM 46786]|uniref:monovalent cation/H+ antiporter complex subunit F n=1 Tax=Blastococcus sp. DSM 46786 TaxID=1798227 RepID=UPI0008C0B90F|nr:monovalent cation/H+ antiporter complex subunit F [Blastococcus sp. DSM 46786]SEK41439.1 multisubunit sodium/proton antiporter, MrpF subunit [Blastococcus sp. DSM 46786]
MTLVWVAAYSMLSAGAALAMVRVWLGPSLLDRVVATETLLAIIAAGVAVYAALARDSAVVPVLLVVALLGFVGAVSVVRYVGGMLLMSGDDDGQGAGLPPAAEQSTEGR